MTARQNLAALLVLLLAAASSTAIAAQPSPPSDVYFVSIGSQTYLQPGGGSPFRWPAIPAPVNSATRVAQLLQGSGARFGILLVSDRDHAVSKSDMERAIFDLKRRIRADNPVRPLVVFYYMGHGLGDPYNQNLYLAPGDMVVDFRPSQTYTNALVRASLTNLDVVTSLEMFRLVPAMSFEDGFFLSSLTPDFSSLSDIRRVYGYAIRLRDEDNANRASGAYPPGETTAIPYVALFDNCYDGVTEDLSRPFRPPAIIDGLSPFGQAALRGAISLLNAALAQVRQRVIRKTAEAQVDGLVLYATRPGTAVTHFKDSDDPGALPVGSLALRFTRAMAPSGNEARISLGQLRQRMSGPGTGSPSGAGLGDSGPVPYTIQVSDGPALAAELPVGAGAQTGQGVLERRIGTADVGHRQ